ncbi:MULTISPECIES: flagellar basal body P-ring formation chaperone FlgA [Oceanotoga]|jgi:flagella basal body P-ring formation protein FlgA|uniref:flagellar basal body P-ring formation chaperone FlgA n=1 Tax=Oceanotoga TaxID=1255275 RepID=UPI002655C73E|nr:MULTISPECIES: flagellar basal body P-ring formation chaperone FlgA [Oceanotoga]MDN5342452.1 flagellar basal body P-ring formation protein FlgA [Oceanotoga sp.]MDO7975595.1 flagellar basal body P-ring formation chaperone FlgA [Oceanotoga teriensis]
MKKLVLMLLLMLFSISQVYSLKTFYIPKEVYSDDEILSLNDLIPELNINRVIGYLNSEKTIFNSNNLEKTMYGILKSYYNDFELKFESETVIIIRIDKKNKVEDFFDLEKYLKNYFYDNFPNLSLVELPDIKEKLNVENIEITRNFLNKDKLYIYANIKTKDGANLFRNYILTVADFKKVLFYNDDLNRNEKIMKNNTYEATTNILTLNHKILTSENFEFGKYITNKYVKKDEILNPIYLKRIPDIKRNDIVTIVVNFSGISVNSWGKALNDGFIGESLTVVNTVTNKKITGILKEGPILYIGNGGDTP